MTSSSDLQAGSPAKAASTSVVRTRRNSGNRSRKARVFIWPSASNWGRSRRPVAGVPSLGLVAKCPPDLLGQLIVEEVHQLTDIKAHVRQVQAVPAAVARIKHLFERFDHRHDPLMAR